jgi:photosystem II stability/assembly factor-like uncharacterized protein
VVALSAQHAFIVDPGAGLLRVTTDSGRTFQRAPQLAGAQWAGFTDSAVGYVIVNEQPSGALRLWRTTDAGAAWSLISLPQPRRTRSRPRSAQTDCAADSDVHGFTSLCP